MARASDEVAGSKPTHCTTDVNPLVTQAFSLARGVNKNTSKVLSILVLVSF